jgi:hypothetical protein
LEDVAVHVVDEDLNLPGELLDDVVIDVRILLGIERRLLNVEEALSVGRRRRARVFELRFGVRGDADDARRFAVVGETRRGDGPAVLTTACRALSRVLSRLIFTLTFALTRPP